MVLQEKGFWDFNLAHTVELAGLALAYVTYRWDRRKDAQDREQVRMKVAETQTNLHAENRLRLEALTRATDDQKILNRKRDEQIGLLATQTATLMQMAAGFERRLQMQENKSR